LTAIDLPPPWQEAAAAVLATAGVVLVVGGPDCGKSTFCRVVLAAARRQGQPLAFIDADLGQSHVGPPTTLGLKFFPPYPPDSLTHAADLLYFIGQTSPPGRLLEIVLGLQRLAAAARPRCPLVLVNTSGLVSGPLAVRLKVAKAEALAPQLIIFLERREELAAVVATGNGRRAIPFATRDMTEIMAFARGARQLLPATRTAIDLGGQGIRVIALSDQGTVVKFLTNDKCSTGTGCFLEVMAAALDTRTEELGRLALASRVHHNISNTCTVFAESEVVSLVARGKSKEDIIAGLLDAMAAKVRTMVNQVGLKREVLFGGGVARNIGAVRALEAALGVQLRVPENPELVGALGAAVSAGGM